MTAPEQIAEFLGQHVSWARACGPFDPPWLPPNAFGFLPDRPTVEELGEQLLANAEFRALRLGHWLGTTDGEVIAGAVEMVLPPFYRQDTALLVDALTYAAKRQNEKAAGRIALGAVATFVAVVLVGLFWGGSSS